MEEKLIEFIDHVSTQGLDHATIRQLLLSAGWRDKQIAEVFCERELELPIPKPSAAAVRGFQLRRKRKKLGWNLLGGARPDAQP